jgi:hypothetical protein
MAVIDVKHGDGGDRLEIGCVHQQGILYVVPAEANWVCSSEEMHGHALAGFFKELVKLEDPQVKSLMQRWGMYFRERLLKVQVGEPL